MFNYVSLLALSIFIYLGFLLITEWIKSSNAYGISLLLYQLPSFYLLNLIDLGIIFIVDICLKIISDNLTISKIKTLRSFMKKPLLYLQNLSKKLFNYKK